MKFAFCVYAFSTDQGSGIQVFEDLSEGLEAYREDLARHHDYDGPADLNAMEEWRESNPTGLNIFLFEQFERDLSAVAEKNFMQSAFLQMASLAGQNSQAASTS